jgi:hypothetical protein
MESNTNTTSKKRKLAQPILTPLNRSSRSQYPLYIEQRDRVDYNRNVPLSAFESARETITTSNASTQETRRSNAPLTTSNVSGINNFFSEIDDILSHS